MVQMGIMKKIKNPFTLSKRHSKKSYKSKDSEEPVLSETEVTTETRDAVESAEVRQEEPVHEGTKEGIVEDVTDEEMEEKQMEDMDEKRQDIDDSMKVDDQNSIMTEVAPDNDDAPVDEALSTVNEESNEDAETTEGDNKYISTEDNHRSQGKDMNDICDDKDERSIDDTTYDQTLGTYDQSYQPQNACPTPTAQPAFCGFRNCFS